MQVDLFRRREIAESLLNAVHLESPELTKEQLDRIEWAIADALDSVTQEIKLRWGKDMLSSAVQDPSFPE
jgi:hypothetical protein